MPDIWGLVLIATKFFLYLGVFTSAGTVFATLVFKLKQTKRFAAVFALIGLITALLSFSLRGAVLTGDAFGMVDPEMLGLLWGTSVGTALVYRMLGFAILLGGLMLGAKGLLVSALGGALAIWSFVNIGHIPELASPFLNVVLSVHLFSIALWIGILTPLRRLALDATTQDAAVNLGYQFGRLATLTVPILILAGAVMSYNLVGSLDALFGTSYGLALILKVALVAGLLGLATINKLRFVPKMSAGDPVARLSLAKSIKAEWAAILFILAVTSLLTSFLILPMG